MKNYIGSWRYNPPREDLIFFLNADRKWVLDFGLVCFWFVVLWYSPLCTTSDVLDCTQSSWCILIWCILNSSFCFISIMRLLEPIFRDFLVSLIFHLVLPLSTSKNTQRVSWELSFICGKMRTAVRKAAPQTVLRNCPSEVWGEDSGCVTLVKRNTCNGAFISPEVVY